MQFQTVLVNLYGGYLIKSLRFRKCKTWILDSKSLILDCDFLSMEHGFWFPIVSGISSGLLELYSGFQSPGFRIPQAKILPIPKSRFPYLGRIKGGSRTVWAVQPSSTLHVLYVHGVILIAYKSGEFSALKLI